MKNFSLAFRTEIITVSVDKHYRLGFPGGKWMVIQKYPNDAKTTPVSNENISYSTTFVWRIESQSPATSWLSESDLQELGELVRKKDQQLENS